MVDGVMGRVLELYHTMTMLAGSDVVFLDDLLCDLKLKPQDVDIPVPAFFRRDNLKAMKEREKILASLGAKTYGMSGGAACFPLFTRHHSRGDCRPSCRGRNDGRAGHSPYSDP